MSESGARSGPARPLADLVEPFGLPANAYGVIEVDPPSHFDTYSRKNQSKAAPYRTMSFGEMARLPVWRLAAPHCAIFVWSTQTNLHQSIDLMKTWGFEYRSAAAWAKQSKSGAKWAFGTGYWMRSAAEFLLVGARGEPRIVSRAERNLIVAPVREHSRKPDEAHAMIERMFPRARRLELFARERRAGWECWGDQVDMFTETP